MQAVLTLKMVDGQPKAEFELAGALRTVTDEKLADGVLTLKVEYEGGSLRRRGQGRRRRDDRHLAGRRLLRRAEGEAPAVGRLRVAATRSRFPAVAAMACRLARRDAPAGRPPLPSDGGTSAAAPAYCGVVASLALARPAQAASEVRAAAGRRLRRGGARAVDALRDEHVGAVAERRRPRCRRSGRGSGSSRSSRMGGPRGGWSTRFAGEARRAAGSTRASGAPGASGVCRRLEEFGRRRLGWSEGFSRLLLADDFFASSARFVRQARAFWPSLALDQLGQALRNVWIGNWLQSAARAPGRDAAGALRLQHAVPAHGQPARRRERVGRQTSTPSAAASAPGSQASAGSPRTRARPPSSSWCAGSSRSSRAREYPDVHARLLAIHDAQSRSLRQHHGASLGDERAARVDRGQGRQLGAGGPAPRPRPADTARGALRLRLRCLPAAAGRPAGRRAGPRGGARDAVHSLRAPGQPRRAHRAPGRVHRPRARRPRAASAAPHSRTARTWSAATAGRCWSAAWPATSAATRAASGPRWAGSGRCRCGPAAGLRRRAAAALEPPRRRPGNRSARVAPRRRRGRRPPGRRRAHARTPP